MATRDDLIVQLTEIREAIANPARQVTLGSQNITLRSIDDLLKAQNAILGLIANLDGTQLGGARMYQAVFGGRGFDR